jgi:hypothetical protein
MIAMEIIKNIFEQSAIAYSSLRVTSMYVKVKLETLISNIMSDAQYCRTQASD